MDDLIKEEKERRARLLIEAGGPLPKAKRAKSSSGKGGKYSQLVDILSGAMRKPSDPEWLPKLPDGIHPDSIFRKRSGAEWKAQVTEVDVSLNGDGSHRHLSVKELSRLYSAIAYANRKGLVFNAHITISWSMLGIGHADHGEVAIALKEFCKGFLTWGRYYSLSPDKHNIAYVYVHEASPRLGLHTHMLVSLPRELRDKLIAWAPKGLRGISKVDEIPVNAVRVVSPRRRKPYVEGQWRWFSYLCKGIDPYATVKAPNKQRIPASWMIRHHLRSPGEIWCRKMVGVSGNIAEGAQKRDGFVSSWQRGLLDVRILYSGEEYRQWQEEQVEQARVAERQRPGDFIESLSRFW